MKRAGKPPDHEHPYGHRQLESIGALIVGSFVITAAIAIFWNSLNSIYDLWIGESAFTGAKLSALWVAIATVIIKIGLSFFTGRIGSRTGNAAVMALAYDHRNDLFSAVAATIGILVSRMGTLWVDPLAGTIVSLFVLRTGITIVSESSRDLMDTVPGKTLADRITTLVRAVPGVEQVEEIHAHRFGPYLVINVTIGVDGNISVSKGDFIACEVEQALYKDINLLHRVYVHYHPSRISDDEPSLLCHPHG
jgi:cation diffusion facilitator family transporter